MKINLKTILCATDFSETSDRASVFAAAMAAEFKARLLVAHVIDVGAGAMYGEAFIDPADLKARLENYAYEHLEGVIGKRVADWEPLIALGRPAEELSRLAGSEGVDLAVTATHGRSGLERFILGSVTERLMHTLPCPLLVVPNAPDARPFSGFKKILVGTDFSPDSTLAVDFGFSLAQEFEAEMFLTHVIEPDLFHGLLGAGTQKKKEKDRHQRQDLRDKLLKDLAELIPAHAVNWCHPHTTLLAGQPHEELIKYAVINDLDLIVLGVHGRGFVENLLVGSTTDRVIRTGPCPVLSVRPLHPHGG
jgi:nucleotide-binding universal stress UspA family protein